MDGVNDPMKGLKSSYLIRKCNNVLFFGFFIVFYVNLDLFIER